MSKCRNESLEKGKIKPTENQNQQTAYIRCALRLLSVVKGLYQACGLPITGTEDLKGLPPLPTWAGNICEQLHRTIFKRLLDLQPSNGEVDWRNLGRLLGVLQRQCTFLDDAWKNAEVVLPDQATASSTAPPESFVVIPQSDLLQAMHDSIRDSVINGLDGTAINQNEFLSGIAEGYESFLDTHGQLSGDRGRTAIYFELLSRWLEIEELRQANPPKTSFDLYQSVAPALGDPRCERFDWFCDVCDEIGLFVKRRGRPLKSSKK